MQEEPHSPDWSTEDNWKILKSCIRSVAKKIIGRRKRKQPEWFEENVEVLMPLIEEKNDAHKRMLATNSVKARKEFRQQQRKVKRAVDQAREHWIRRVALEGETAVKDGKTRWECIRRLQLYAGRKPIRPSAARKENGELTQGPMEMLQRWQQHFSKPLNHQADFKEEVLQHMHVLPPCLDLDEPCIQRRGVGGSTV